MADITIRSNELQFVKISLKSLNHDLEIGSIAIKCYMKNGQLIGSIEKGCVKKISQYNDMITIETNVGIYILCDYIIYRELCI